MFVYRSVYERADKALRNAEEKEERVMVLEAWKELEVLIHGAVFKCRKTKTREITLANRSRRKQHNEPIRIRSK